MLQVVSTGAYYPPVDTTWKILTTGASQLTAGALCTVEQKHYIVGQTRGWLLQDNRCLSPRSSHIAIWWNNRELFLKRFQETPRVWIKEYV